MINTYKEYAFEFKPGNRNGKSAMFCQVWLKDAIFATIEQGHFDEYAFRFKFVDWQDMPKDLAKAINDTYLVQFNPVRKELTR